MLSKLIVTKSFEIQKYQCQKVSSGLSFGIIYFLYKLKNKIHLTKTVKMNEIFKYVTFVFKLKNVENCKKNVSFTIQY